MEQVHGVDVSWMTQGSPKGMLLCHRSLPAYSKFHRRNDGRSTDKFNKAVFAPTKSPVATVQPRSVPSDSPPKLSPSPTADKAEAKPEANGKPTGQTQPIPVNGSSGARRLSRSGSVEKNSSSATPPHRRNSWFSNISAKFSSSAAPQSNGNGQVLQQPQQPPAQQNQPAPLANSDPPVPKITPTKNAVLQHGLKPEGDEPYTPAPPKSGQAGLLGVFRRLSSSSGGGPLGPTGKINHGLVERRILNVDRGRERCPITELKDNKLRRVSFLVDVEIAPMPKYADGEAEPKPIADHAQKKKLSEKGEGEALKNPKTAEAQKEASSSSTESVTTEAKPREAAEAKETKPTTNGAKETDSPDDSNAAPKDTSRKKEKKKRSEEERKARKEKRRRLAEESGIIPIEIHYDTAGSLELTNGKFPTTCPKITEQLSDTNNILSNGAVNKIDLTGYFMQLQDLITLGDYLAVVPVKEIILQNSGLTDEGVRVILAGLLAAKYAEPSKRRKSKFPPQEMGGVVERLVLKENKLGPDGWKHISLFIYKCHSLKYLDLSCIPFPRQAPANANGALQNGVHLPLTIGDIFSKALANRPTGSTLEMLSIGETEPSMEQLGKIIDGVIKCGIKRLGMARNPLDEEGAQHVVRYLESGKCEGLDLGGIDLKEHMDVIASSIKETDPLWALSMSDCNINPSTLCKILPILSKLEHLVFIDLSHNHDLFQSTPNAVGLLRRYLPKMQTLKRLHLSDVGMTSEQAIAIVEVVPEAQHLCHLSLLGNTEIMALANAKTEEAQEEACALYASLMAAARLSSSMICVDIEVPSEDSGEIVKAMAKQVVAYCLQNIEHLHDVEINKAVTTALAEAKGESVDGKLPSYPDVLAHLVGQDVLFQDDPEDDGSGPDEDYVIGGTGVVKALACCLKNRGDESRRASGEFLRELSSTDEEPFIGPRLRTGGKAKDFSKHLLAGARKIRLRLQPALNKARANPSDELNLRKLTFLDDTLQGIIKRFEDEYPDTREHPEDAVAHVPIAQGEKEVLSSSPPAADDAVAVGSDVEEEGELREPRPLSRSNSILGRKLAEEEGRVHRAGHRFRSGITDHVNLLSTLDDVENDPNHVRVLADLADDVGGEFLEMAKQKGAVQAFKDHRDLLFAALKESDPEYWDRFVEAQGKARANINLPGAEKNGERPQLAQSDESAIAD
ncbi:MAP-homologous protein 1 [Trichoderma asperellum]|uniref:MAP-homologous protein 1 n=1 Tax=Trichoderma asperellum TaxID=101201 RepID=A0A6V8QUW6_TRIAP|nr:MAP-homologous protein 1 [Trichoderma asperellum]